MKKMREKIGGDGRMEKKKGGDGRMEERLETIIVFHYTEKGRLPKLSQKELHQLRCRFLEKLKEEKYQNVYFDGTYVDEKGQGVCIWRAPSAAIVEQIVEEVIGAKPLDGTVQTKRVL